MFIINNDQRSFSALCVREGKIKKIEAFFFLIEDQ